MKAIIPTLILLAIVLGALLVKENDLKQDALIKLKGQQIVNESLNDKLETQYNIDECIDKAFDNYKEEWVDFCKLNKIKISGGECKIPVLFANDFDNKYQKEKEMCITRYK